MRTFLVQSRKRRNRSKNYQWVLGLTKFKLMTPEAEINFSLLFRNRESWPTSLSFHQKTPPTLRPPLLNTTAWRQDRTLSRTSPTMICNWTRDPCFLYACFPYCFSCSLHAQSDCDRCAMSVARQCENIALRLLLLQEWDSQVQFQFVFLHTFFFSCIHFKAVSFPFFVPWYDGCEERSVFLRRMRAAWFLRFYHRGLDLCLVPVM